MVVFSGGVCNTCERAGGEVAGLAVSLSSSPCMQQRHGACEGYSDMRSGGIGIRWAQGNGQEPQLFAVQYVLDNVYKYT